MATRSFKKVTPISKCSIMLRRRGCGGIMDFADQRKFVVGIRAVLKQLKQPTPYETFAHCSGDGFLFQLPTHGYLLRFEVIELVVAGCDS